MLVSAWAKKSAFLWAAMPPLVAMLIEKIAFGTSYVAKFLAYRLRISDLLGFNHGAGQAAAAAGEHASGMLDRMKPWAALANVDLWLGLAATAALVWLTIRIRRHQSDS